MQATGHSADTFKNNMNATAVVFKFSTNTGFVNFEWPRIKFQKLTNETTGNLYLNSTKIRKLFDLHKKANKKKRIFNFNLCILMKGNVSFSSKNLSGGLFG